MASTKRSPKHAGSTALTGSSDSWKRAQWWLTGGATVGMIALVVFLFSTLSGTGASDGSVNAEPASVPAAFDFDVWLYQGWDEIGARQISFGDLLGGRPIVLNYWASNCPPCSAEMPEFQRVYETFKGEVTFFGLDIGRFSGFGGPDESVQELGRLGVSYLAAPAPDVETIQQLQVQGLPSTDFIMPSGEVFRRWVGTLNEEKLTEIVHELVDAS